MARRRFELRRIVGGGAVALMAVLAGGCATPSRDVRAADDVAAVGDPSRPDDEAPDPFLFPRLVDLIPDVDAGEEEAATGQEEDRATRRLRADIRDPGPDIANFPNSAFTLPKGRAYLEATPATFYGPSAASSPQYNAEVLLRYGLTDDLEFRLFSNGLTVQGRPSRTTGFSPLTFDLKAHLWDENRRYFLPAVGLEAYIQTTFGSPAFNTGTQPSLSILCDHTLPGEIALEYNVGVVGTEDVLGETFYQFNAQWSLQKWVTESFAVFHHGFINASNLPRVPGPEAPRDFVEDEEAVVIGGGAIWNLTRRLALFGSYNAGLTRFSPTTVAYVGCAVAF